MNRTMTTMISVLFLVTGCPAGLVMAQDEKPMVQYVQNLQQAIEILKPAHKELVIARDPFDPIIVVAPPSQSPMAARGQNPSFNAVPDKLLGDLLLIGIVRLEDQYRALVMIDGKPRVVNVQDKIRNFTITSIDMGRIILKSADQEIIKKRGKL